MSWITAPKSRSSRRFPVHSWPGSVPAGRPCMIPRWHSRPSFAQAAATSRARFDCGTPPHTMQSASAATASGEIRKASDLQRVIAAASADGQETGAATLPLSPAKSGSLLCCAPWPLAPPRRANGDRRPRRRGFHGLRQTHDQAKRRLGYRQHRRNSDPGFPGASLRCGPKALLTAKLRTVQAGRENRQGVVDVGFGKTMSRTPPFTPALRYRARRGHSRSRDGVAR